MRVLVDGIQMLAKRLADAGSRKYVGFVLGVVAVGFASTVYSAPLPTLAPLNPDFVQQQLHPKVKAAQPTKGQKATGLMPSPIDRSHMVGQKPSMMLQTTKSFSRIGAGVYPTTFDLRTSGYVTSVKDQGQCGDCWSFSTISSVESNSLAGSGGSFDFSENHQNVRHGFDWTPCNGGNGDVAGAYMTRWGSANPSGLVYETDDPYTSTAATSVAGLSPRVRVQEFMYLPDRASGTDNDNYKYAIQNYGAVAISVYADSGMIGGINTAYWNQSTSSLYYDGALSTTHGGALVGWDDNYAASNFSTPPPGNGAFIVKNSWGSGWGQSGYYYISYYDTKLSDAHVFRKPEAISNYTRSYLYDPFGQTSSTGFGTDTAWGANVFTAAASETLQAVAFNTLTVGSSYEVYIYTNVTGAPSTGVLEGGAVNSTGSFPYAGYHTVVLSRPVSLVAGQKFAVVIKFVAPGYTLPIPIEMRYTGYDSAATASPGQSYISGNGTAWTDLTSVYSTSNVNIRAFTAGTPATLPDAPTIGTATAGNASASIPFTPGAIGSGTLVNYTANCGGITSTGVSSPITVSGLAYATAYTCMVNTVSTVGAGPWSAPSNSVTTDKGNQVIASKPMLTAGLYHSVALKADGTVSTWGNNQWGQLGDGTTTSRLGSIVVPGLSGVLAVAAGGNHSVLLKADGTVMTWGENVYGQLGDGTITQRNSPVAVPGLSGVVAVATSTFHTVALKSDGTVAAWGNNNSGELGDGTTTQRNSPVSVPSLTGVMAVTAGLYHTVALKSDGTVVAWGRNSYGQLGDGTITTRLSPITVPGLSGVVAVAAGNYHTLALKADGTVVAWGYNSNGQLGDGTITQRNSPVVVPGLAGVLAVAAGVGYSVALKSDWTLTAWGLNTYGELGDGTTTQRTNPVAVPGLTGVVAVAAGDYSTVAFKSDGTVTAWGRNDYGQLLADGTTTQHNSPVAIQGLTVNSGLTMFSFSPTTLAVGGSTTVSTSATSGLIVDFSSTTPSVCSVSGSTVIGITSGTCTIAANQAGDANYNAAPQITQSINVESVGVAAQSISFGTAPTIVVGGTGTVSATGGASGNPVTFTSSTTGVCTVSGSNITGVTAGTCTIAANQAGNSNYSAASQVTQNITVGAGTQSISFGAAPSVVVGGTGTVSATGGASGNPVTFSSTTTGVCTISGSTVTGVTAGTCTIAANQTGNSNYSAATQVTQNITVGAGTQSISFGTAPTVIVNGTGTVSATGGASGNLVTFSSTTTGVCTISGSTVTGVTAGTCTIAANQAGDANYSAASQVTQNITVGAGTQSISFGAAPTVIVNGTGTVSATGGASGNPITFSSSTTGVCTVSGSTVTGVTAGTCTIAADQAGNSNYSAATQVTQNITVGVGVQSISFGAAPTVIVNGTGTVSATGGASGNTVTFTSSTTGVCTISGSTVTGVTAGTCTIAGDQTGDANYNAASQVTQNITVGAGTQSISFGAAPTLIVNDTGIVSATGGASGNPVTFSSTTAGVCTVSGSTVTGVTAGTCTIAADQAGNSNYSAASQVTQNITVGAGAQSISFGAAPTVTVNGTGTVSATGGASGNPVTFSSSTAGICTVSGSTVTGVAAGTCTIAADQTGDANYNAATQVTQTISVGKASQTITAFGFSPNTLTVGGTTTVSASGGASGSPIMFTSSTLSICTVSGNTVTSIAAGSCTITANQAGNANYDAAPQVTQTIATGMAGQTLSFGTAPTIAVGGTGTVSATATSGLAVIFSSTTTGVCTISGNTVTGVTAGTCTIAADQTGDANYNAASQVTQNITVGAGTQNISFGAAPNVAVGGTGTVSATGGASGNAVTFSSTTTGICTISGSTVTGVTAGTCIIAADQTGDANYSAATQAMQNITVGVGTQSINFGTAPTVIVNGTGTVSATGGASGNPVTFSSSTTGVCTVSGSTVTGVTAGTCTIAADQAGNSNYSAASQVTQTFSIGKAGQTIGTISLTPATLAVGGTSTASATATSGLAVNFTSTTPAICTVSGSTVTGVTAGTCTIAADQTGDASYNAATQVMQNITVGAGTQNISFGVAPIVIVNGTGTVSATGGASGNAVTFTSTTTGVCTVSGSTVTGVTAGTCTIAADQAGDTNYSAANQATQNITVGVGSQNISFGVAPTVIVGGTGTVSATGGASGNLVTFSSTTTGVCTISGSTVTGVTAGTCTIAADQAGDANYSAATQATQNITVGAGTQSINFGTAPTVIVNGTGTVSATGGASGNAVTFSSMTTGICTISGNTVTGITAGTCTIAANQAGNSNYDAASQVTQNITVGAGAQSISFGAAPTVVVGGVGTVSATGGVSGNAVTFSSMTTGICTISGNTVTGVTAGTCTIAANQAGNANYSAATQVTQSITVGAGAQSISFVTAPSVIVGGTGTVSATGGASGNTVTFSSTTTGVCTISGNTVTGVTAGTCTIAADQAGNSNYSAASQVTQNITIGTGTQSINFGAAPTVFVNGTGTVSATGGVSGNPVTFSSTTTGVCTISGSTVTGVTAGTCTIAANQAGNSNYSAATQVTQIFSIGKAGQAIGTISLTPATLAVGGTSTASATATSGLAVNFTSTTPAICTVSGSTVTGVTAGTCTIAADQTGDANYNAASQVTQNISVGAGTQNISFGAAPIVIVNGTGTVSATGGASGNAVTFSSSTTGVCTVSGNTVTGVTAGTCTIAADQAGNSNYDAATQVTQNITVGAGAQSISFGAAPIIAVGGTGTVSATGGASANAVTFTSTTTGVCTISGSTVTGVTAGTCTIAANQAGNSNYSAASQVTQNISVAAGAQSVSFGAAPNVVVGGVGTVSATGGASGNPVTFSSSTTGVCTVSGSTVTGVTAGSCTIAANQAGNSNYSAATQVTQTFSIGKAEQTIDTISLTPATLAVGGTSTASATATSGLAASFTSTTPTICTVSGSIVTGVTAGTCTIAADQAGNSNYNAATQVTQNFTVGAGTQNISFGAAPTVIVNGTGTVSATGGASGNLVTFSSTTTGVCTVSGNTVTGVTAGTCTIAANQAGNSNYNAASQVTQNISIGKASQTIGTISFTPTTLAVGGTSTASATATSSLVVSFTSTTPTICTVSGSTVTGIAAGTCTIAANQAGNANYSAATQVTQNSTIGAVTQSISFGTAPTVVVGGTGTVSATGGASGNAVTFTSSTTAVCTVSGSTVTGVTAGTCTIAANQAGNSNYSAATQVTQNINIGKTSQTIGTISFSPATLAVGSNSTASATATSGLAVSFSSATPGICSTTGINGSTITSITAGICTITADQSGNANNYAATQVELSINTLVAGWNLIGNSVDTPLDVATAFGDSSKVTSVWKWTQATSKWSFYAPSLSATNLAAYAANKGYDVLTTVNGGEGIWVNAKQSFSVPQSAGNPITAAYYQDQADPALNKLGAGWSLISMGDNITPSAFNLGLSVTPPASGTIPTNVTTLWVWDSVQTKWYFYAPSLEAQGGSALTNYITNKGFLDFTANGKTLGQGGGFWVNRIIGLNLLPAGYVEQGGLVWSPNNLFGYMTWPEADAYCANFSVNGVTGWRLPTQPELSALYTSGAMNGQGWTLNYTWSSLHSVVGLNIGDVYGAVDGYFGYVSCVHDGRSGNAIYAIATTTAQNLTVGTAMDSFSPLTARNGATPYTYSYTGTLPSGLSFNTSTGAVTGTPTAIYATANLVFSVHDANNVVASTISTVSFTVVAPAGYVSQGGLTWMPVTFTGTWADANTYCTNTTIIGQTGWRLPTQPELSELSALYATIYGQGWTLNGTWSSTQYSAGYHYRVYLNNEFVDWVSDTRDGYVSCVR